MQSVDWDAVKNLSHLYEQHRRGILQHRSKRYFGTTLMLALHVGGKLLLALLHQLHREDELPQRVH